MLEPTEINFPVKSSRIQLPGQEVKGNLQNWVTDSCIKLTEIHPTLKQNLLQFYSFYRLPCGLCAAFLQKLRWYIL